MGGVQTFGRPRRRGCPLSETMSEKGEGGRVEKLRNLPGRHMFISTR